MAGTSPGHDGGWGEARSERCSGLGVPPATARLSMDCLVWVPAEAPGPRPGRIEHHGNALDRLCARGHGDPDESVVGGDACAGVEAHGELAQPVVEIETGRRSREDLQLEELGFP